MLSDSERALVRQAWSTGPGVLIEKGMSADDIRAFFGRPDVMHEIALLDAEFKHTKTLDARVKFVTRRNVSRLSDGAVATLARAMMGDQYMRHDETGAIMTDAAGRPIMTEKAPSTTQVRAAEAVLEAVGVSNPKILIDRASGDVQPLTLLESAESKFEIDLDPTYVDEEQRALSRERMRTTIEVLMEKLPDIKERVMGGLEGSNGTLKKRKVRKRNGKKKVTKRGRTKKKGG